MDKEKLDKAFNNKSFTEIKNYIDNQMAQGENKVKSLIEDVVAYATYSMTPLLFASQKTNKKYNPYYINEIAKQDKNTISLIFEKNMFSVEDVVKFAVHTSNISLIEEAIKQKSWYEQYNEDFFQLAFKKPHPHFIKQFESLLIQKHPNFTYSINEQLLSIIVYSGSFINLPCLSSKQDLTSQDEKKLIEKIFDNAMYISSENYTVESRKTFIDFVLPYMNSDEKNQIAARFLSKMIDEKPSFELFDAIFSHFQEKIESIDIELYTRRNEIHQYLESYEIYKEKKELEKTLNQDIGLNKKIKI